MRLVVSDAASALIQEQGGRLYVWVKRGTCCGGATRTLATASEPPARKEFRQVAGEQPFDLFVSAQLKRLPSELHFDVRRFPRRVEAYWNGCAWIA